MKATHGKQCIWLLIEVVDNDRGARIGTIEILGVSVQDPTKNALLDRGYHGFGRFAGEEVLKRTEFRERTTFAITASVFVAQTQRASASAAAQAIITGCQKSSFVEPSKCLL